MDYLQIAHASGARGWTELPTSERLDDGTSVTVRCDDGRTFCDVTLTHDQVAEVADYLSDWLCEQSGVDLWQEDPFDAARFIDHDAFELDCFDGIWSYHALLGQCDELGGSQYRRAAAEWQDYVPVDGEESMADVDSWLRKWLTKDNAFRPAPAPSDNA